MFADPAGNIETYARYASGTWLVQHRLADEFGNQYTPTIGTTSGTGDVYLNAVSRFISGMEFDTTTGLFLAGDHWYDPTTGRFLTPDASPDGGGYAFVPTNPMDLANGYVPGIQSGGDPTVVTVFGAFMNGLGEGWGNVKKAAYDGITQPFIMFGDSVATGWDAGWTYFGSPINYKARSAAGQALESGQLTTGKFYYDVATNGLTFGIWDEAAATYGWLTSQISDSEYSQRMAGGAFGNITGAIGLKISGAAIGKLPIQEVPGHIVQSAAHNLKNAGQIAKRLYNDDLGSVGFPDDINQLRNQSNASPTGTPKEIIIDSLKYPESAQHLQDAGSINRPLTVNRAGAAANRREALRGIPKVPGMDLDEAPPAVLRQPGDPVSVRPIPSSDNKGSGATLGIQLRGVPENGQVIIRIKPGVKK